MKERKFKTSAISRRFVTVKHDEHGFCMWVDGDMYDGTDYEPYDERMSSGEDPKKIIRDMIMAEVDECEEVDDVNEVKGK